MKKAKGKNVDAKRKDAHEKHYAGHDATLGASDSIAEFLRRQGFKATAPRMAIIGLFMHEKDCKPMDAEEVHSRLGSGQKSKIKSKGIKGGVKGGKPDHKKIDLVTVYRTLTSFEEAGILKQVDLRTDSARYELASHHHHHIVCTSCGLIEGFDACNVEALSKKAIGESSRFSIISGHSLELFGLCNGCLRR